LFRITTVLVVAMILVAAVIVFFSSKTTPDEVAQAQAERRAMYENCVESGGFGQPPGEIEDVERFCRDEMAFMASDPRFDYGEMTEILRGLGIPFLMLGWIVGASFIGAEWHNRMLTTTLTWEPRRVRVLAAKILALAFCVAVWLLVLQAVLAAALYPAAAVNGITETVDAAFWRELGSVALRVDALAVLAALLGFALATIGRNTAAALGVGFAYLTVVEGLVRGFKPEWSDWLLGDNIALFLVGSENSPLGHDQATATWFLLAYCAALLVLAAAIFRRREMS
jgi:hypothetical protein